MTNTFQKAMINNKDIAWKIIKVFHPDILEEYPNNYKENTLINTKDRLKIYSKYDWVCIEVSAKGYIDVHIGIEFECKLFSGPKPLHSFEKELKNNEFRAWRFNDDSKSKIGIVHQNEVNKILISHNIPRPTAKEMSEYYHSD